MENKESESVEVNEGVLSVILDDSAAILDGEVVNQPV